MSTWSGHAAHAQPARPVQPRDGVPAALDTMIQPAHRDYARYVTPGMCLRAVSLIAITARRATIDTTLAHVRSPELEPLPDSAVATARACGTRFTPETVPPAELLNLAALALAAHDDARAVTAAERWRTTVVPKDTTNQAWALLDEFRLLAQAHPARLAAIDTIVQRLDALGRASAYQRAMVASWSLGAAERRFDATEMVRRGFDFYKGWGQLTPHEQNVWLGQNDGAKTAVHLGAHYSDVGGASAVMVLNRATAARAPGELGQLRATVRSRSGATWTQGEDVWNTMYRLFTTPLRLPQLQVTYWFGDRGAHRWPEPGRASVLLEAVEPVGEGWFGTFAMLRRVCAKYGDALNVTLVYKTKGYFRESPPLDPAAEAETARKYYLEYLKLPVNLAVAEVPVTKLPDGRRILGSAAYEHQDGYYVPANTLEPNTSEVHFGAMIAGRQGETVLRAVGWPDNQGELEAYIDRALKMGAP